LFFQTFRNDSRSDLSHVPLSPEQVLNKQPPLGVILNERDDAIGGARYVHECVWIVRLIGIARETRAA
jgi:hypothetical protein